VIQQEVFPSCVLQKKI